jgi:hypothetical protein
MPISPNQGSTSGGTLVTITGVNLSNVSAVYFGNNAASSVTSVSPTQVTAISPAGTGVAYVSVVTSGGASNSIPFYYIPSPIVTSLSTSYGPLAGGNTITVNGYNLGTATSISFGESYATPTVINDAKLTVTVPAGAYAGQVNVCITAAGGTCSGFKYNYVDSPTISTITPSSGSTAGGESFTITGTELLSTTSVTVNGNPAAFGIINSTTISVIVPAGQVGSADVVVTNAAGSATAVEAYTYVSGPGI